MRRLFAVLSSAAIALGVLMGAPSPASAANVGTVTVTGGGTPSVSPTVITGQVGDTFTIAYSGPGGGVVLDVIGSAVSLIGGNCSSISCSVSDGVPKDFTIESAGSVVLDESGSILATLTIVIGGSSSSPTDPALVYPTAYLNANGGTCSGAMQFTKFNGQNGTVVLPGEAECQRPGYSLRGWGRSGDIDDYRAFWPGMTVPIGDESFTLYAIWSPTGALITYDANVAADTTCVDASGNRVLAGAGRVTTALNPTTFATAAPCSPDNAQLQLVGWASSGSGPVAYEPGAAVSLPAGTSQRLYAVWQPTTVVSCEDRPAASGARFSVSCTDFGDVPVGWRAIIEVRVRNNGQSEIGLTVLPYEERTVTSNGILERFREPGDCSPDDPIFEGGSCIVRYAWTPAEPGPLTPLQMEVCTGFYYCTKMPSALALRGNAYMPQPEPETPTSTPAEQPEEVTPSLAIEGERGEVKGKPGVIVNGEATGLEPGTVLIPWLKFPGQTEYTQGAARPEVQVDGTFTWQRRTGKKIYVYFTSEDGALQSDRVIIPGA